MKFSKQRNMILDTVTNNPIHPTADEVYSQIKAVNPTISLGTVYRNLNLLSETGALRKIFVANDCDRFDARMDEHFHLICSKCRKVVDVELTVQEEFKRFVEQDTGFKVTTFDVVFRGVCPTCSSTEIENPL